MCFCYLALSIDPQAVQQFEATNLSPDQRHIQLHESRVTFSRGLWGSGGPQGLRSR